MKKYVFLLSIVMSFSLLFGSFSPALATTNKSTVEDECPSLKFGIECPKIYINGEEADIVGVIPPSGATLVPFRPFFEALNIESNFDNATKTVTAKNERMTVILTAGKQIALVNGKKVPLIQSPAIEGRGIMVVNVRFIAETFGGIVSFDKKTLTINIDFPNR